CKQRGCYKWQWRHGKSTGWRARCRWAMVGQNMPEGILIDYNDSRPAMAITAGLRAPSFCTSFAGYGTGANQFQVNTPLTSGSTVFVLRTRPV
ncbi:DUF6453 family protein, partial [Salmonella enterica]|uniref:DUF6453 family protein n=1 Tax=Salmonella enterica TaxID=28901 RepID=UPI001EE991EB